MLRDTLDNWMLASACKTDDVIRIGANITIMNTACFKLKKSGIIITRFLHLSNDIIDQLLD